MAAVPIKVSIILFFLVIGSACVFTGVATSYWLEYGAIHKGIFQECYGTICKLIPFFQDTETEVTRLLLLAGCGCLAIITLLIISIPCAEKNLMFPIIALHLGAFLSCAVAMGFYTYRQKKKQNILSFQWSFYLAWIGCSVNAISLCVLMNTTNQRR